MTHSVTEVGAIIANIVPRFDRQEILCGIAVFCDNLYQNSNTTVGELCFVVQFEKEVQDYETARYCVSTLLSLTSQDEQLGLDISHIGPLFYDPRLSS